MTKIFISGIQLLCFLGVIALSIFNVSKYGPSLSFIFLPAMGAIALTPFCKIPKITIKRNFSIFIFWFCALISTVLSTVVTAKQDIISLLVICVLFICVASLEYSQKRLKIIIYFYTTITTICSISMIINYLKGDFYIEWFKRVSFNFLGVAKDPNYVAAYISLGVFFSFVLVANSKFLSKKFNISAAIFLVNFSAVFLTGSRGSLVSIIIAIFVYIIIEKGIIKVLPYILILLVLVGVLLSIAVEILPKQSIDRLAFWNDGDVRTIILGISS